MVTIGAALAENYVRAGQALGEDPAQTLAPSDGVLADAGIRVVLSGVRNAEDERGDGAVGADRSP
jgi:hypothetical protein